MYIRRVSLLVTALLVASTVDEAAGQVVRVSVATDGTEANSNSVLPAMLGDGPLRGVHVVRVQPGARRHQRRRGRVPARPRHRQRRHLRRARRGVHRPRQPAPRRAGQRPQQRAGDHAGRTLRRLHVVRLEPASRRGCRRSRCPWCCAGTDTTGDIVLVSQTTGNQPLLAVRSTRSGRLRRRQSGGVRVRGSLQSELDAGFRGIVYRRDIAAGTLTQVSNELPPSHSRSRSAPSRPRSPAMVQRSPSASRPRPAGTASRAASPTSSTPRATPSAPSRAACSRACRATGPSWPSSTRKA